MEENTIFLKKIDFISKLSSLFTAREKWQFAAVMAGALAMAFFQALGVASILPFMNIVMRPEVVYDNRWYFWFYNLLGFSSVESFIISFGFLVLGVIVAGNLISALAIWMKMRFVWRKQHNLSTELMKKYLSLPYVYFLNHHSADLSKNILSEVNELTRGLLIPLLRIGTKGILVLFILGMLLFVEPAITLLAVLVVGGSYGLIYSKLLRKLRQGGKKRLEANRERFKAVNEALGGIKDIKIMGREAFFIGRFFDHSWKYSNLQAWYEMVGQIPRYILEIIAFGGVIAIVLFLLSIEGTIHQVIPMVSFFAFAGYRLMPAMQEIFLSYTSLQYHRAVLDKIYEDMNEGTSPFIKARDRSVELPKPLPFHYSIELDGVSFWYPRTNEPVLRKVSLNIHRHTSVAIAGPTGSGKTTLVDIILGLLTPQQGRIKVDDTEVTEENVQHWQRSLGYVPQQIYLCDDTMARNIAFGLPDNEIDPEALENAVRFANLENFIANDLPHGYATLVGERGVRLSGGQRQRVGIARALYHDPEILILDEATSSLDGITEDAVLEAIENAAKVKTVIIIAHRLTTVRNCDTIYMLDRGEIVAEGTYSSLLSSNAQFRAMAKTTS